MESSIGAIVLGMVVLLLSAGLAMGQPLLTDQVSITSERGQIFGITPEEGIARQFLASGEEILTIETQGVTGFVHTTKRLLGFSGRMRRWFEFSLSATEQIERWVTTPQMVVVIGTKQAYGFQSDLGRWKKESWGAGEVVRNAEVKSHVGIITTNRRAVGFSALTGGFFSLDLPQPLETENIQINDHIVILDVGGRTFVLRSGLALWTELP